jgi:hypothetical protein
MFAPELKSGAVKVVLEDWLLPPHDLWGRVSDWTTGQPEGAGVCELH